MVDWQIDANRPRRVPRSSLTWVSHRTPSLSTRHFAKMARIPPCDSFATPPPSALRTPASAAPTASRVKCGLEDEHADSPRPRVRPASARGWPACDFFLCGPAAPQPLGNGQPTGGREAALPLLSLSYAWPAGCWPPPLPKQLEDGSRPIGERHADPAVGVKAESDRLETDPAGGWKARRRRSGGTEGESKRSGRPVLDGVGLDDDTIPFSYDADGRFAKR